MLVQLSLINVWQASVSNLIPHPPQASTTHSVQRELLPVPQAKGFHSLGRDCVVSRVGHRDKEGFVSFLNCGKERNIFKY